MSPAQEAKNTLERHWDNKLPVNPTAIAYGMGVQIVYDPNLDDKTGSFSRDSGGPVVFVNPKASAARQRVAIFRELGHYLLGHDEKAHDDPAHEHDAEEEAADIFATEMIMPETAVKFLADRYASLSDIARRFNVSAEAMRIRLEDLGLLKA